MDRVPLGFHFRPTRRELIEYLKIKARGGSLPSKYVLERNLYGDEATPWQIFSNHDPWESIDEDDSKKKNMVVYVFTKLSYKGPRTIKRTAGIGTWSGQNKGKNVLNELGEQIGMGKMLTFETKNDGEELKATFGHWIMHEYSLSKTSLNEIGMESTDYVVCKITRSGCSENHKRKLEPGEEISNARKMMKSNTDTVEGTLNNSSSVLQTTGGEDLVNFEGSKYLDSSYAQSMDEQEDGDVFQSLNQLSTWNVYGIINVDLVNGVQPNLSQSECWQQDTRLLPGCLGEGSFVPNHWQVDSIIHDNSKAVQPITSISPSECMQQDDALLSTANFQKGQTTDDDVGVPNDEHSNDQCAGEVQNNFNVTVSPIPIEQGLVELQNSVDCGVQKATCQADGGSSVIDEKEDRQAFSNSFWNGVPTESEWQDTRLLPGCLGEGSFVPNHWQVDSIIHDNSKAVQPITSISPSECLQQDDALLSTANFQKGQTTDDDVGVPNDEHSNDQCAGDVQNNFNVTASPIPIEQGLVELQNSVDCGVQKATCQADGGSSVIDEKEDRQAFSNSFWNGIPTEWEFLNQEQDLSYNGLADVGDLWFDEAIKYNGLADVGDLWSSNFRWN